MNILQSLRSTTRRINRLTGELAQCLQEEQLNEAERLFKKIRKIGGSNHSGQVKDLWLLATQQPLSTASKQWLEEKIPLNDALPHLVNITDEDLEFVKASNFFKNLATYNHDLVVNLSQDRVFNYPWEALNGTLMAKQITKAEIPLWQGLLRKAEKQGAERMVTVDKLRLSLLMTCVRADNLIGVQWTLRLMAKAKQNRALGMCLLHSQPDITEEIVFNFLNNLTNPWLKLPPEWENRFTTENIDWQEMRLGFSNEIDINVDAIRARISKQQLTAAIPTRKVETETSKLHL